MAAVLLPLAEVQVLLPLAADQSQRRKARRLTYQGKKVKTNGGLFVNDLMKNTRGKIVSKKVSVVAKTSPWIKACALARKNLGLTGFVPVKSGSYLHSEAKHWLAILKDPELAMYLRLLE